MIRDGLIALVAFVLLSAAARAQIPPDIDDPLGPAEFLLGHWRGDGDGAFGKFRDRIVVEPILGGRILSFRHTQEEDDGLFEMRGHLTRDRFAQWRGSWSDGAGFVSLYRGRIESEGAVRTLVLEEVQWNGKQHFVDRWTFRLEEDGSLHSIREVGEPGALDILIRSRLTREE